MHEFVVEKNVEIIDKNVKSGSLIDQFPEKIPMGCRNLHMQPEKWGFVRVRRRRWGEYAAEIRDPMKVENGRRRLEMKVRNPSQYVEMIVMDD